ncbi:phosphatidate cytidylyltransferase [Oceanisphaera profunda]|uniref:Phosphatidate cytidylyltransferase n=1 Tax=Oceanisphaera profunda TaxID=1416627 RepID=A0A1Y0D8P4_9GAMM|nr:phosphatidate cytidylyltransferase [Oceanisphaera profunda]ART83918.1 phosphatidate cytidylyltransferase [Oceanisphaera profunda]
MLKLRIITALCLVPLVLAALFLLPFNYFALFAGAIFLLASIEWGNFIDKDRAFITMLAMGLVLYGLMGILPLEGLWTESTSLDTLAAGMEPRLSYLYMVAGAWWVVALGLVLTFPRSASWWRGNAAMQSAFAFLTLVPFYWAMMTLRGFQYQENPHFGAWLLLFVMGLVWAADTGAYFVGRAVGKRKLCPNVSPGKTVEGMLGGVASATVLALIVTFSIDLPSQQTIVVLIASIVAVLASVLGDLTESMFKREAGLKDSGNILPGHGGIMDRIDSLTAALPVFVLVVWLLS